LAAAAPNERLVQRIVFRQQTHPLHQPCQDIRQYRITQALGIYATNAESATICA
jgi:hypothetical protein